MVPNFSMAAGPSRRTLIATLAGAPLAATFGLASGHAAASGAAFRKLRKAMWVWKFDEQYFGELARFAAAESVDTMLLSLPAAMRAELEAGNAKILSRLRTLKQGGRSLLALTGDPSWVNTPQRLPQSVGTILTAVTQDGIFDGISLDVEPNALPGWHDPGERAQLMAHTLTFYATVRAAAGDLPIDAALNPAFAALNLPNGQGFLASLCAHLSSVSLMAYRDSPERILEWAEPAIAVIEAAQRPWWLGVLVHATSEKGTSFVGTSRAAFEADMVELDRMVRLRAEANYRGLIFEDYDGLKRILGA